MGKLLETESLQTVEVPVSTIVESKPQRRIAKAPALKTGWGLTPANGFPILYCEACPPVPPRAHPISTKECPPLTKEMLSGSGYIAEKPAFDPKTGFIELSPAARAYAPR